MTYYPTMEARANGHPVYFEFHPFCGPTFYCDRHGDVQVDDFDRIPKTWWGAFEQWRSGRERRAEANGKQRRRRYPRRWHWLHCGHRTHTL